MYKMFLASYDKFADDKGILVVQNMSMGHNMKLCSVYFDDKALKLFKSLMGIEEDGTQFNICKAAIETLSVVLLIDAGDNFKCDDITITVMEVDAPDRKPIMNSLQHVNYIYGNTARYIYKALEYGE